MATRRTIYNFHSANLSAVQVGLDRVALSARQAIAKGEEKTETCLVKLYALLLASWAETRLLKLIHEKRAFTVTDRALLLRKQSHGDRWKKTVTRAFTKHFKVKKLTEITLGFANYQRYKKLIEILKEHFDPIIGLRNRLAHGQWVFPLNIGGDALAPDVMEALKRENFLTLQFKRNVLFHVSEIVHNLVVSKPWFESAFEKHYKAILDALRNLKGRDYKEYKSRMQERLRRGRIEARRQIALLPPLGL